MLVSVVRQPRHSDLPCFDYKYLDLATSLLPLLAPFHSINALQTPHFNFPSPFQEHTVIHLVKMASASTHLELLYPQCEPRIHMPSSVYSTPEAPRRRACDSVFTSQASSQLATDTGWVPSEPMPDTLPLHIYNARPLLDFRPGEVTARHLISTATYSQYRLSAWSVFLLIHAHELGLISSSQGAVYATNFEPNFKLRSGINISGYPALGPDDKILKLKWIENDGSERFWTFSGGLPHDHPLVLEASVKLHITVMELQEMDGYQEWHAMFLRGNRPYAIIYQPGWIEADYHSILEHVRRTQRKAAYEVKQPHKSSRLARREANRLECWRFPPEDRFRKMETVAQLRGENWDLESREWTLANVIRGVAARDGCPQMLVNKLTEEEVFAGRIAKGRRVAADGPLDS